MLWQGIRNDVGATAASEFVLMVEELEDMSASAFLVSFENYFHSKFRWRHRKQQPSDGVALSGRGDALFTEALWAVGAALGRSKDDERWEKNQSWNIKAMFLRQHSTKEQTGKQPRVFCNGMPIGYFHD